MSDLQEQAARNNAAWCDAVCRWHGLAVHRDERLWWTSTRSPAFYPDAVTLHPGVTPEEVLTRVDAGAGCSVKDSFATLDLARAGFRVLFEAQWIGLQWVGPEPQETRRAAQPPDPDESDSAPTATRLSWQPVRDRTELDTWAAGHGEADALLPAVLAESEVRLFLASEAGQVRGGLALNRSVTAVGVSNLFASGADPARLWGDVAALAARTFPGLPVVGYEGGEDLAHAQQAGFSRLGPLRIWIR